MNLRGPVLPGLILTIAGLALALDWAPGADGFATGPKIGMVMLLWTLAAFLIGIPLTQWILRMTTRPSDYQGNCPVGESCPECEAFNLKPRTQCRVCDRELPIAAEQAATTAA